MARSAHKTKSGDPTRMAIHRATMNILDDFDQEKTKLAFVHRATLNLLEDFDKERRGHQLAQRATLNLLEDMNMERSKLGETQHALMNMLEDIETERVHAELAKSRAEDVNKELEAFSYSVSHDLRAPLRAISGFSDAVAEDCAAELNDEGRRYLGLIRESALKMGKLIDDLLSFSRLSRQEMRRESVSIGVMARTVFSELAAKENGRVIKFSVSPDMPDALGDTAMIQQVLVNLLSNAVKFTRTRSTATIEFGYRAEKNDSSCVYYVQDNGVGFDMQYADKLFTVFQRLHTDSDFEGTGVGLALVARIIARHGGRVWVEGKVDKGAIFYFTFSGGAAVSE